MRWSAAGLHLLAVAVGTGLMFHPTLTSGFRRVQTDAGDTLLNLYVLEHSWRCLSDPGYRGTSGSPPFFFPEPEVRAFSESLIGAAPIYWLMRLGLDEVAAYQAWMIAVAAGTYAAMAGALRGFGVSHLLSAAGGLLFAYGAVRMNQLNHQQLLPNGFAPLAVLALGRFLQRPRTPPLAAFVGLTVAQVAASVYLGWFFGLGLAVFAAAALNREVARRCWAYLRDYPYRAGAIALIGSLVLVVLLEPYVRVNRGFRRHYADCVLPGPRSWLAAPPDSVWAGPTEPLRTGLMREQWLFGGLITTGLFGTALAFPMLKGIAPADRTLVRAGVVVAVVLVALTLRLPGDASAWRVVFRYVPGATGVRAVTRVFSAVHLFGLIAGCVAADRLLRRVPARWAAATAAGLLLVAAGEQARWQLPSFEHAPVFERVEAVRAGMAGADAAYVELDPARPFWEAQLVAMLAGQRANVPVVNGYSGRWPTGYPAWDRPLTETELRRWLTGRWTGRLRVLTPDGRTKAVLTID